jgi:hypothetical protein
MADRAQAIRGARYTSNTLSHASQHRPIRQRIGHLDSPPFMQHSTGRASTTGRWEIPGYPREKECFARPPGMTRKKREDGRWVPSIPLSRVTRRSRNLSIPDYREGL